MEAGHVHRARLAAAALVVMEGFGTLPARRAGQERVRRGDDEMGKMPVVIKVRRPSVGPGAAQECSSAQMGFDWDRGKFIIFPQMDIAKLSFNFLSKLSIKKSCETESKNFFISPRQK